MVRVAHRHSFFCSKIVKLQILKLKKLVWAGEMAGNLSWLNLAQMMEAQCLKFMCWILVAGEVGFLISVYFCKRREKQERATVKTKSGAGVAFTTPAANQQGCAGLSIFVRGREEQERAGVALSTPAANLQGFAGRPIFVRGREEEQERTMVKTKSGAGVALTPAANQQGCVCRQHFVELTCGRRTCIFDIWQG